MEVVNLKEQQLDRIGKRIDAAWKRVQQGETDWIEGSLELMQALGEARRGFTADKAFGAWLKESGHDHFNAHDRAALIGMASDLTLARDVLTKTDRRSYQHIWNEVQGRFAHVSKPRRKNTERKPRKGFSRQAQSDAAKRRKEEGLTQAEAAKAANAGSVQNIKQGEAFNDGEISMLDRLLDAAAAKNFTEKGAVRIDDAIRIHQTRLNRAYEQHVNDEVRRRIAAADDATRKHNKELSLENLRLSQMLNQRGVFTEQQFGKLLMCVHPDNTASVNVRNEMLQLLVANKRRLVKS